MRTCVSRCNCCRNDLEHTQKRICERNPTVDTLFYEYVSLVCIAPGRSTPRFQIWSTSANEGGRCRGTGMKVRRTRTGPDPPTRWTLRSWTATTRGPHFQHGFSQPWCYCGKPLGKAAVKRDGASLLKKISRPFLFLHTAGEIEKEVST